VTTEQEQLLHVVAFDTAREITPLLTIRRGQQAAMFFELFQAVKVGLEEFRQRKRERQPRLVPGNN